MTTSATPLLLSVIAAATISTFMFSQLSSAHPGGEIGALKVHYAYSHLEVMAVTESQKFNALVQACQSGTGHDCGQVMKINTDIVN